jgi:hypothetical protein
MGLEIPTDEEILESEFSFYPPQLPRIPVRIPEDLIIRYEADKLAKFIAREGFHLEEEIKRKVLKGKSLQNETLRKLFS